MINSKTIEYYHTSYVSNYNPFLCEYLANRSKLDRRLNIAIIVYLIAVLIIAITLSRPIFAYESPPPEKKIVTQQERIYLQKNFEENIKNKYNKSHITFPTKGIAHIKTTKYINKKPATFRLRALVDDTGLEPVTPCTSSRCSSQLS